VENGQKNKLPLPLEGSALWAIATDERELKIYQVLSLFEIVIYLSSASAALPIEEMVTKNKAILISMEGEW